MGGFFAAFPPARSKTWFAVSATEWTASASIDEAPVSAHAPNFIAAIKAFAVIAATIALVPPCALMATSSQREFAGRNDQLCPVAGNP